MKNLYILGLFIAVSSSSFAQKNVFITIAPKENGNALQLDANLTNSTGVVYSVTYFDYYLSNLHIIHDGGQDLDLSDTVFLIEPANHILHLGILDVTTIEQITFGVGVPPNLNTQSGADAVDISTYPEFHPLSFQDPSMYWGWTSGYTHMIIEGRADSNNDGTPETLYQIHNLGNSNFHNVVLPVTQTDSYADQIDVYVNCNVDVWLKNINIKTIGVLHGSSGDNTVVMNNVLSEPVFDQSATASVPAIQKNIGKMYFSTIDSKTKVTWEGMLNASNYKLTDLSGKLIASGSAQTVKGDFVLPNLTAGMYNFHIYDENANLLNSLKVLK